MHLSCSPANGAPSCARFSLFFLILTAIITSAPAMAAAASHSDSANPAKFSPALAHALQAKDAPGQVLPVWVYFVPRDLTATQRDRALSLAEKELNKDTASRRARVRQPGQSLALEGDLPLDQRHLDLAAATGARLRHPSRWLGAASYNATPRQIQALAALDCVRRVDLVRKAVETRPVPATGDPLPPTSPAKNWSLDYGASLNTLEMINVPQVHEMGFTGAGVKLAFLDSGFRLTHEAMVHVPVLAAYDMAGDDSVVDWEEGEDEGLHSHGTQVSSAAVAYAPGDLVGPAYGASLILAKVDGNYDPNESEEDWWIAGLEWVEAQGADLVSSSYGFWYTQGYDYEDLDGDTAAATIAADQAVARGLPVINAAGNSGADPLNSIVSPADGDSVIAVGAVDADGLYAFWSSYGPTVDGRIKPDVATQGQNVPVIDAYDDFAYSTNSGTSLAAPLASAVAALVLERVPFLTPMQLREALRETASQADQPDNLLGWGVLDALAAVYYWGPNFQHEPLTQTEDTVGPYIVAFTCTDQYPLTTGWPKLLYRVDGGPWQEPPLVSLGGDLIHGEIPGQPNGTTVEYYMTAQDDMGLSASFPHRGAAEPLAFTVSVDTEAPVLVHGPVRDTPLDSWPPAVVASVTDNIGVAEVLLTVAVNGGPASPPVHLLHGSGDLYGAPLPVDASTLVVGDAITYTLTATDTALGTNTAQSGPHTFTVISGPGDILVLYLGTSGSAEAASVSGYIQDAGYSVTVMNAGATSAADFAGKRAVVYLGGKDSTPLGSAVARQNLEDWVAGGGRLFIEGGEVGFCAAYNPGYPSIMENVLHASSWFGDNVGDLLVADGQENHPLLNGPLPLTTPVTLVPFPVNEEDQDVMTPLADATVVLQSSRSMDPRGVIVHDDNPLDSGGQVVYVPVALSALTSTANARALVVNSLAYLLDTSMPSPVEDEPGTDTPRLTRLLGAVPNPFNAHTSVHLEMARTGPARVELFDLRGRLVRCLHNGGTPLEAGPHQFPWDGRDDAGHAVSSGVYFVRLTAEGVVSQGKIALVK